MKTQSIVTAFIAFASLLLSTGSLRAEETLSLDQVPPVVIKTVPEAGATDVDFGPTEIRITYSKTMSPNTSFTLVKGKDGSLIKTSTPKLDADGRTFVLKIKLEPNTTYFYFANNQKYKNFRDTNGNSALPYQVIFSTKAK